MKILSIENSPVYFILYTNSVCHAVRTLVSRDYGGDTTSGCDSSVYCVDLINM